jgi:hypothetical protein
VVTPQFHLSSLLPGLNINTYKTIESPSHAAQHNAVVTPQFHLSSLLLSDACIPPDNRTSGNAQQHVQVKSLSFFHQSLSKCTSKYLWNLL